MSLNATQSEDRRGSYTRKLRYRELLSDLANLEEEDDDIVEGMQRTMHAVREVKDLLSTGIVEDRVKHPGEGYLDSCVLRASSDLAVRFSEAVSGNVNTYNRHELAAHIKENPDFWEFPFPREVPPVAFLFGTFAPTPPEERAPRRRAQRETQRTAALKAPETVDKSLPPATKSIKEKVKSKPKPDTKNKKTKQDRSPNSDTDEEDRLERTDEGSAVISQVKSFIRQEYNRRGKKPISYFHLVLDPDSFSRTVENIYRVSFLVREGNISVQVDENHGLPFVQPVSKSDEHKSDDISDENQFIVSLDMHRWQDLLRAFNIHKPMMVLRQC